MSNGGVRGRWFPVGAEVQRDGTTHFRVWAPRRRKVAVAIEGGASRPHVPLERDLDGYFAARIPGVAAGSRYRFQLDGESALHPDPASRSQPDGPEDASEVIDPAQEVGPTRPFVYFADTKPELARAVRKGRTELLMQFEQLASPASRARLPDPGDRLVIANLAEDLALQVAPEPLLAPPAGMRWRVLWSSEDPAYGGDGVPPVDTDDGLRFPGRAAVVLAPEARS